MVLSGHVYELKGEKQNRGNPAVHGVIWLNVRVVEHAGNVFRVDFEVGCRETDKINSECAKGPIYATEFNFSLWVSRFSFFLCDGAITWGTTAILAVELEDNPADGDIWRVNSYNKPSGCIIKRTEGWGWGWRYTCLEEIHRLLLLFSHMKRIFFRVR